MFTINDVADHRTVDGLKISLSLSERQAICDEWNAGIPSADARAAEQLRLQSIRDDALRSQLLTQLSTATNLQISQFVDNQVSDLASAKTMLKRILLLLAAR